MRIHYLQYGVLTIFDIRNTYWIHGIRPILQRRHRETVFFPELLWISGVCMGKLYFRWIRVVVTVTKWHTAVWCVHILLTPLPVFLPSVPSPLPITSPMLRSQYFQHISHDFILLQLVFTLLYGWFYKYSPLALLCSAAQKPSEALTVYKINKAFNYCPAPTSFPKASCPFHILPTCLGVSCPNTLPALLYLGGSPFTAAHTDTC